MCSVSFALGRWRAERGKPLSVALAVTIDLESYRAGFEKGRQPATRRPPARR